MSVGEDHICTFPDILLREGNNLSQESTVGQVLKGYLLLGPNTFNDWPGSARNVTGHVMEMITSTVVTVHPTINFASLQFTGPPRR